MLARSVLNILTRSCAFVKTVDPAPPRGSLTIVPTPIGNLRDISPNMLKALFAADLIACQDRRVAGKLYMLIKNRNLLHESMERFGSQGMGEIVQIEPEEEEEQAYQFYNYSNMTDKQRRKFLRRMPVEQQEKFRVEYMKYRAVKKLKPYQDFDPYAKGDKLDELYGIDISDLGHIERQIAQTRQKKGRGLLIPLNTYNQTKMFDMVRALLQSKKVALVSDAGMPCISDPGWKLVQQLRTKMPLVPIKAVGGPSSVGIMIEQASLCSKGRSLSGRFEGFSTLTTGNFSEKDRQLIGVKLRQFSINFTNAHKLKPKLIQLQKSLHSGHRVLVANQLTKQYERRYHGSIPDLINKLDSQKTPKGQISYLVYPKTQPEESSSQNQAKYQDQEAQLEQMPVMTTAVVSMQELLDNLTKADPNLTRKQKCNILCAVFGIKQGEARKLVYVSEPAKKDYARSR